MTFDKVKRNLSKILTISAGDYFRMNSLNPKRYKAIGIHVLGDNEALAEIMPEETEAVVDYRLFSHKDILYSNGTALIRKKKMNLNFLLLYI